MGAYNDYVLFIHIPKTGGWSVKNYMREHLPDVLMPDDPRSKLPIGHVRLQDIERFTGRSPDSFALILAVLRNPYEQQISQACFWAKRFMRGGRHVHDINTWRHVFAERVETRAAECIWSHDAFAFEPGDFNLTGFVSDPRCDFHVWYEQHFAFEPGQSTAEQQATRQTDVPAPNGRNRYQDFGGLYRYWLTVDGKIPDNVRWVPLEALNDNVPKVLRPFAGHDLPPLPVLNASPWKGRLANWYTGEPYAASIVTDKFRWAFGLGCYPKMLGCL
jgi:hypothetical protein